MEKMICDRWKECDGNNCGRNKPFLLKDIPVESVFHPKSTKRRCGKGWTVTAIPYVEEKPVKYKLLKPVSIRDLIMAQGDLKCKGFWRELQSFQGAYAKQFRTCPIGASTGYTPDFILSYISDKPKVRDWLLDKGFIGIEEELKLKPCRYCKTISSDSLEIIEATDRKGFFQVHCPHCGMMGPHGDSKKWAATRYNKSE